ncbi:hypothetical protein SNOG_08224 [Parastagonospora nodorum SN15]|uniref:Amidohydrolase-related domain-containing protein n=1 Tax=Phaeosphaeria nodorum (strain SN15 / ATCC MYA-4574 / FGSC 10173) TaxID=321614 RepID=Q0UJ40_PHANO|nr:hypothetical protein SNOG_08224 [Parastagonospora nodorum SN15]EAT84500.2 hypothetical protein SNOG_08224 [Parastagonospora nodorum SN15]
MAASAPIQKTIYLGTFVHSKSLTELDIYEHAAIGVDENGIISFIEKDIANVQDIKSQKPEWKNAKTIIPKYKNSFFFPGFIDTHTHAPQHPNTGLFGKTTLLDWLQTYTFPMEASFTDLDRARKIYSNFVSRTLSHGTTTAAYYATIHVPATNLLADICLKRGQRALVGRVCMDSDLSPSYYRDASVESSVADSSACISYIRSIDSAGEIVRPILTPRFAPSCTSECLRAIADVARETASFVQTHISENVGEIALVKEMFPQSTSYTDVYDTHGLLTPKTILAHAVHLSEEERRTIRSRGNVSGGFSPSILENVRQAIWVSRHLSLQTSQESDKLATEEALYLATRGGAKVVGLEDKVGGFEVGMEWDAQMVVLGEVQEGEVVEGQVDVFGWEKTGDKIEKWVLGEGEIGAYDVKIWGC